MKILDFAPIFHKSVCLTAEKPSASQKLEVYDESKQFQKLWQYANILHKSDVGNYEEQKSLLALREKVRTKRDQAWMQAVKLGVKIDEDWYDENWWIHRLISSPKIKMEKVRELADTLGFILFPFNYLHDQALKGECRAVTNAVDRFKKNLGVDYGFDLYVLAPPTYYSVSKHIEAENDDEIYAAPSISQAFMALSMSVPIFRSMWGEIQQLRNDYDYLRSNQKELQARVQRVESEIRSLWKRLEQMEESDRRRREREIRQRVEAAAKERLIMYDPMMIAVVPGEMMKDGVAVVGPCWGPDFKTDVVRALGLRPRKTSIVESQWEMWG